ncbi:MAG: metal ABC transporter permease [Mycobacterium leprae]
MLELFGLAFMQRALLAGIIIAVISPAIGLFLVLRRLSQFGDTLAHVSLAGVAAGMLTGTYPVAVSLGFAVAASLIMDWLRQSYRKYSELSVAIMLSASLGLAVVLLSMTRSGGGDIMGYLFGSIMTVSSRDLYLIGALGLLVLAALLLLYKELLSVTFDEELARISGLPVRLVNLVYVVLTAVTVAVSMRVVGVLLVSALMVVPVATALQVARSFRSAFLWSIAVGLVSVVAGLLVASAWNLAPGGAIVLSAVLILLVVVGYKRLRGVAA